GEFMNHPYDYWLALCQLAIDLISNSSTASTFAQNPSGYLATMGFPDVEVDPDSMEFQVIKALGDPTVRRAARSRDPVAFLDFLRPLGFHTEDPEMFSLECAALVNVVAGVNVVAAVDVIAGVNVLVAV